jgi:hypothetical protein
MLRMINNMNTVVAGGAQHRAQGHDERIAHPLCAASSGGVPI